MTAPREISALASYVDAQLADLRLLLEAEHKAIFPIWAESTGVLSDASYDWAFGGGSSTDPGQGVVIPFRSGLIALSLSIAGGSFATSGFDTDAFDTDSFLLGADLTSDLVVQIEKDGTLEADYVATLASGTESYQEFPTPLEFHAGSVLNFYTLTNGGGAAVGNRISAWFRKE